jgi:predicted O-methyltransferase YrrM
MSTALESVQRLVKRTIPLSLAHKMLLAVPQLYPLVRYESQLTREQLAILTGIITENRQGNIIECGVYRAGTTVQLARLLKERGIRKTIYALDSFAGFEAEIEDEIQRGLVEPGGRAAFTNNSVEYVRRKVRALGVDDVIRVVPGFFESTLPTIEDRFCLAFIDCDLEKSTEYCLGRLWDRVVDGGCLVVDDYENPYYPGAAIAADRFFARVGYRDKFARDNFLVVKK